MMMIMTPSNWLKDSAGQTRMESIKDPAPPPQVKVSFLSVTTSPELGRETFCSNITRGKKIFLKNPQTDRKNIFLGQNIDYSTCLDQEGNEGGV